MYSVYIRILSRKNTLYFSISLATLAFLVFRTSSHTIFDEDISLAKIMPIKDQCPTQYTVYGTPMNRGVQVIFSIYKITFFFPHRLRRLNPMIFLTICCTLFVIVIVAALIVFTFLPIFTSTKQNHTTYQSIFY